VGRSWAPRRRRAARGQRTRLLPGARPGEVEGRGGARNSGARRPGGRDVPADRRATRFSAGCDHARACRSLCLTCCASQAPVCPECSGMSAGPDSWVRSHR